MNIANTGTYSDAIILDPRSVGESENIITDAKRLNGNKKYWIN